MSSYTGNRYKKVVVPCAMPTPKISEGDSFCCVEDGCGLTGQRTCCGWWNVLSGWKLAPGGWPKNLDDVLAMHSHRSVYKERHHAGKGLSQEK